MFPGKFSECWWGVHSQKLQCVYVFCAQAKVMKQFSVSNVHLVLECLHY